MKIPVSIRCVLFFFGTSHSLFSIGQQAITFQKKSSAFYGNAIAQCAEGGYIISGRTLNGTNLCLFRIDDKGDTLWSKYNGASGYSYGTAIIQTHNRHFIACGYSNAYSSLGNIWYVVRIDSLGNTIWRKDFFVAQGSESPERILEVDSNKIIIAGITGSGWSNICLLALDSSGNMIWNKQYGKPAKNEATHTFIKIHDGFIIGGIVDYSINPSADSLLIIKTNSFGDTVWTKFLGNGDDFHLTSITPTNDSCFVLTGNCGPNGNLNDIFLLKIDSLGNTVWSKKYKHKGILSSNVIKPTISGGFIIGGRLLRLSPYNTDGLVIEVDSLGNVLWAMTYGHEYADLIEDIALAPDKGLMLLGFSSDTSGHLSTLLIKTDSLGNSGCNELKEDSISMVSNPLGGNFGSGIVVGSSMIAINTQSSSYPFPNSIVTLCSSVITDIVENKESAYIFNPNPVTETATLQLSDSMHKDLMLSLYDAYGRLAQAIVTYGADKVKIDKGNLKTGLYFFILQSGQQVLGTGKMIVK